MPEIKVISTEPEVGNKPYVAYELEEDTARVAYHYEVDPQFFLTVTDGEWNNYSASIWEDGFDITQAQEKKLDKFAEMMGLKPGMRIMDVGCGWGGPLVYLCKTYGVQGHGITVSPMQIPIAEARAERYGVDATFEVIHWQELPEVETYDAIFTDEVIVHFNDLSGFFAKCHKLLKKGGMLVNKELHFTHSSHAHWTDRLSQHINKVYAYTGNYRTLVEELTLLDQNNFQIVEVHQIPIESYRKTIDDVWLKNLHERREELEAMTSPEHVADFRAYLKAIMVCFRYDFLGLHMVAGKKLSR